MNNEKKTRKLKLLFLWELLKSETDENHPMSTNTIIARLAEKGIEVDRKILYDDILLLIENGHEVEIERKQSNNYYVIDRSFDLPEIRILMDAVQAAGFITEKKTEILLDKISALAGNKRKSMLKENIAKFSTPKSKNEHIYYSIDTIMEAKSKKRKISFNYFDYDIDGNKAYRKDGKTYIVNPVSTVFDNDQYYLICYDDKHENLTHYRVDRMDNVRMLEEKISTNKNIERTDLSEYKRQLFSMYSGKVERISFECDESLIAVMHDQFGTRVKMSKGENGKIKGTAAVQVSPMFIAWACSFGNKLKITKPDNITEKIKEHLNETLEQYK